MFRGQRANAAVLRRNREDIAPSFHHRARRGRGNREATDVLGNILELRPRLNILCVHQDGNFPRVIACQAVLIQQPAIFIDDRVWPKARPLDIVFFVIGKFLGFLRAEVVAVEIHHAVAVADEIDARPVPHRKHVHAFGLGQLFIDVVLQVVDGDGQVPAAVVALPGPKFL